MAEPGWIIYACRTSFAVEVAEVIWRRGEEVVLLVDNLEAGDGATDPAAEIGAPLVRPAELSSAQRDLLWKMIELYSVEHFPAALSTAQRARVQSGDRQAVHFAWYAGNTPETAFGYRVIGDGFVIEMASVDAEAQHLHTIYHDLGNVLGRSA